MKVQASDGHLSMGKNGPQHLSPWILGTPPPFANNMLTEFAKPLAQQMARLGCF